VELLSWVIFGPPAGGLCQNQAVGNATAVQRRVAQLCASLESDAELRGEIERGGFSGRQWQELADEIRGGSAANLAVQLNAVETAAVSVGLDGVTSSTRAYSPLERGGHGFIEVTGWLCPHRQSCGRAELAAVPADTRRCALTGDPMTWASVTSG
jgi:hypothetical protein